MLIEKINTSIYKSKKLSLTFPGNIIRIPTKQMFPIFEYLKFYTTGVHFLRSFIISAFNRYDNFSSSLSTCHFNFYTSPLVNFRTGLSRKFLSGTNPNSNTNLKHLYTVKQSCQSRKFQGTRLL